MGTQHTGRPNADHAASYAKYYLDQTLAYSDLLEAFEKSTTEFEQFISSIPADKADYRYADDKWSVKGVISHCIDTERIFQYRALRFSRKDETALSGFDEDLYGKNGNADSRTLADLRTEFLAVRSSSIQLFTHMSSEMLDFLAAANGSQVSPRSLGWMIIGHTVHHMNIIKVRYLVVDEELL